MQSTTIIEPSVQVYGTALPMASVKTSPGIGDDATGSTHIQPDGHGVSPVEADAAVLLGSVLPLSAAAELPATAMLPAAAELPAAPGLPAAAELPVAAELPAVGALVIEVAPFVMPEPAGAPVAGDVLLALVELPPLAALAPTLPPAAAAELPAAPALREAAAAPAVIGGAGVISVTPGEAKQALMLSTKRLLAR